MIKAYQPKDPAYFTILKWKRLVCRAT